MTERTVEGMVAEFHEMLGDRPVKIGSGSQRTRDLRQRLLKEEFEEYLVAEDWSDLVKVADALGDLVYVAYGTANRYGLPLDAIIAEIHRSNMTKESAGPGKKAIKGHGYEPPRIKEILEAHGWRY